MKNPDPDRRDHLLHRLREFHFTGKRNTLLQPLNRRVLALAAVNQEHRQFTVQMQFSIQRAHRNIPKTHLLPENRLNIRLICRYAYFLPDPVDIFAPHCKRRCRNASLQDLQPRIIRLDVRGSLRIDAAFRPHRKRQHRFGAQLARMNHGNIQIFDIPYDLRIVALRKLRHIDRFLKWNLPAHRLQPARLPAVQHPEHKLSPDQHLFSLNP